jgi:hypothetical protein
MIVKVKGKRESGTFFIMNKTPIQSPGLSWAAKGLLAYLISLPDDWELHISELYGGGKHGSRSSSGKKATEASMQELIKAGFVVKTVLSGKDYRRGTTYTVYEDPDLSPFYTQGLDFL